MGPSGDIIRPSCYKLEVNRNCQIEKDGCCGVGKLNDDLNELNCSTFFKCLLFYKILFFISLEFKVYFFSSHF